MSKRFKVDDLPDSGWHYVKGEIGIQTRTIGPFSMFVYANVWKYEFGLYIRDNLCLKMKSGYETQQGAKHRCFSELRRLLK